MHPKLTSAEPAGNTVTIRWSDGATDAVTVRWLRHACHCPACRTESGGQLRFDVADLADEPELDHIGVADGRRHSGEGVAVTFGDGHAGFVPTWTLADRRARPAGRRWGIEHSAALRLHAVDDDLDRVARAVVADGIAMLSVPPMEGAVVRVAERLGVVRRTNYGHSFDVVVEPDPANLANSADALPLHTDNPYRDPVPTVQLLHCLTGGDGGASRFADGFGAAERLATTDAEASRLLRSTFVTFRYVDDDVDMAARAPLIETDDGGAVTAVRLNNRSMQAPDLPAERIDGFYRAHRAFVTELERPRTVVELTLGAGDLVVFDNRRVLHGRTAFTAETQRHLQGCYIDVDALRSRARRAERDGAGLSEPREDHPDGPRPGR